MPAPIGHPPYNKNGEGGKPKYWTDERIDEEADAFWEWLQKRSSYWFTSFATERGYSHQRLTEWAAKNQKFADVYEYAKSWQQDRLAMGALTKTFDCSFTKFVMANTCGWTDKSQTQISGDAANPLDIVLNRVTGTSRT